MLKNFRTVVFYHLVKLIGIPVVYIAFFPKIIGRRNLRIKGKAIYIANHTKMWDPLMITVHAPRVVRWMSKAEFFESAYTRWFFNFGGAFAVHRGENDLPAVRQAFKLLRDGKTLGIFPEGTRNKDRVMKKFEQGTALIALKNKAPIIPIYIKGEYKMFRRMKMIVGEPIVLNDHVGDKVNATSIADATRMLEEKLKELRGADV